MSLKQMTTIYGRQAIVRAHAGDAPLPRITHIAVGVGGHDPNDPSRALDIDPNATGLVSEVARLPIERHDYPTPTTVRYYVRLDPAVLAGAPISEAGLVDETGRVVAIQHFGAKVIDAGTTWEYHWEEEAR